MTHHWKALRVPLGVLSGAVLEAPAPIALINDAAVACEAVEECRGHLGANQD